MRATNYLASFSMVAALVLALPAAASERALPTRTATVTHGETRSLIVRFKDGSTAKRSDVAARTRALELTHAAGISVESMREMSLSSHVITFTKPLPLARVDALAKDIAQSPDVLYAEADAPMYAHVTPNDPRYTSQWHLADPFGGINAPMAWDFTTGSNGTVIAVLDTGATPHPDLQARYLPGYDFISDPLRANDGDGRDADPTDAGDWINAADVTTGGGFPTTCRIRSSSWHGTMVAGAIGAIAQNNDSVVGLDWAARILPVRVLGKCGGATSDIADAMLWAAGFSVPGVPDNPNPAKVINMSLGGGGACGATYQAAVDRIVAAGKVIVVSAGNDNIDVSNARPANCTGVIAVAATNRFGAKAGYSNSGAKVDIAAPGGESGDFITTGNSGATRLSTSTVVGTSGTSFSAPVVSGVVGLMLALRPELTTTDVRRILQRSARPFPDGSCGVTTCGAGIVDAAGALRLTQGRTLGLAYSMAFGDSDVGSSRFVQLRVSNDGAAPLTVSAAQITGAHASEFALGDNRCATATATGGTCELQFTFNPRQGGLRQASLNLSIGGTQYALPLVGFGYASASATDFRVPTAASAPNYLTVGPDGAIWFTLFDTDRIGRIPADGGSISEFPVTPFSSPNDITTGRDGNLWFTLQDTGKIGRMTPTGALTEFNIPTPASLPRSIVAARDGFLYFTQIAGGKIGRVGMDGTITEFTPNWSGVTPRGIDTDTNGNLWFADSGTGSIARMTPAGEFTRFAAPWANGGMRNVKVARDGSVWFTEAAADRVGRFDPATQSFREFMLTRSGGQPFGITQSADGNIWFTSVAGNRAGRITTDGVLTELRLPTGTGSPVGIISAPDGQLWYAAASSNRIGRINPRAATDSLNVQDLWWSAGENGHGLSIQQKGTNLFITWYLYDATGRPNWVVVPAGRWNSDFTEWTGDAYTPRGTWFARYDARQVQVGQPVGQLRLRFASNDAFTLTYSLNNTSGTKQFTRFAFGQAGQVAPGAYADMWYGGTNNGGWGLAVNQQSGTLFMAWYTYDQSGAATWFVVPSGSWAGRTYTGRVFKTTGAPVLGAAFNPNAVRATDVGSMEVTFTPDGRNASLIYTVEGQSGFESIGRLPF